MASSSKKRLVIHIGSHKTATTHIQGTFAKNTKALAGMSILYPVSGQIYEAHFKLCWKLRDPELAGVNIREIDAWAALIREFQKSDATTAIISSEEFGSNIDPRRLAPLKELFDVTIISYLRSPDRFFQSFYNQFVKDFSTRECRTINEYLAEEPLFFLNTRTMLEPWVKVFGLAAVQVRLFDRVKRDPGIVSDFLTTLGFRNLPAFSTPNVSTLQKVSLPPDILEYLRLSNPYFDTEDGHHSFVVDLVKMAQDNKNDFNTTRAGVLSLKSCQTLRKRFAAQNVWAAKTFWDTGISPFPISEIPPQPADFYSKPEQADAKLMGKISCLVQNHLRDSSKSN